VWHSFLTSLAASDAMASESLKNLLEAAQNRKLPQFLKPRDAELDGVASNLLKKAFGGSKDSDEALLFRQILVNSGRFYSPFVFVFLIHVRLF